MIILHLFKIQLSKTCTEGGGKGEGRRIGKIYVKYTCVRVLYI